MDKIAPYYKAVAGLLVPFLTAIGVALTAGSDNGSTITGNEWITAIVAGLLAGGVVFAVPNKDPNAEHQEESVQPPDVVDVFDQEQYEPRHGNGELGVFDTGFLVAFACLIIIIVGIVWLVQAF